MKYLLSFDSVHFAMEAESYLEGESINFKTIPTPREITTSCGLAILIDRLGEEFLSELDRKVKIKNIYLFEKLEGNIKKIEKIR